MPAHRRLVQGRTRMDRASGIRVMVNVNVGPVSRCVCRCADALTGLLTPYSEHTPFYLTPFVASFNRNFWD